MTHKVEDDENGCSSSSNGSSTQYNSIQAAYDIIRGKSIAFIEKENVETIIAPFIRDATVLELACGSGFYTYDLLKWGAKSVVAVDISEVMVQEAQRRRPDGVEGDVTFLVTDCTENCLYPGAPFDLVFAAWLLDNAPDRAAMVQMFRNVAINLKPGGQFVSVTATPASDPRSEAEAKNLIHPPPVGAGGVFHLVTGSVEDGVSLHCHGYTDAGEVSFDCYYLRKEVYESAAKEAGLMGQMQWSVTSVPERYLRGEGPGGAELKELHSFAVAPQYGLLTISKSA